MTTTLDVRETPIPGLLQLTLPVHEDGRGWFKENWQREKMVALGLPDFGPVQNNVSFNATRGTTRGLHAEPWDKFVSVTSGRVFGAWVDLRRGPTFGQVHTTEIGPGDAVFVPRGVANGFQTLEDATTYAYLVNAHWSPDAEYAFVNLADPTVAVPWPVPLDEVEISDKDRAHPTLDAVEPVEPPTLDSPRTLVLGALGQLGRALVARLPRATAWDLADLDLSDADAVASVDWTRFDTVLNASAYTAVDAAETPQGRRDAWRVNVHGVAALVRAALAHDLLVVHVSSDYVFDGEEDVHTVDETFSPLGVYGQTKAAGDAVVSVLPRHYVVRTSWVVGDGPNFVRTMRRLAADGVSPAVVDDQVGRLTSTDVLADGILALVDGQARFGVHHVTGDEEPRSWFQIARDVYAEAGADPDAVRPTSTEAYAADRPGTAPRPRSSVLSKE